MEVGQVSIELHMRSFTSLQYILCTRGVLVKRGFWAQGNRIKLELNLNHTNWELILC